MTFFRSIARLNVIVTSCTDCHCWNKFSNARICLIKVLYGMFHKQLSDYQYAAGGKNAIREPGLAKIYTTKNLCLYDNKCNCSFLVLRGNFCMLPSLQEDYPMLLCLLQLRCGNRCMRFQLLNMELVGELYLFRLFYVSCGIKRYHKKESKQEVTSTQIQR